MRSSATPCPPTGTSDPGRRQTAGPDLAAARFRRDQHLYSAATELAKKTNSVVVAPHPVVESVHLSGGGLNSLVTQEAAAQALLDPGTALCRIKSALAAGYHRRPDAPSGRLRPHWHSAGGGFLGGGRRLRQRGHHRPGRQPARHRDVRRCVDEHVRRNLHPADPGPAGATKPVYQLAAPAQAWNLFGATSNELLAARPNTFDGVVLVGGSHVDSMLGVNPDRDTVLQLVAGKVPPGNTAATYT